MTPNAAAFPGESIRLTEAARDVEEAEEAESESESEEAVFDVKASAARCSATSADEHAVSTATAAPPSAKA